ncbi:hypothetical protein, partial [uncultured Thiohalocapsa sp.]|uniref:hypothetical protein n=1 Tax=uncultured Thiohalocapsa sp. TaxID=768990 RepID=UPI0025D744D3
VEQGGHDEQMAVCGLDADGIEQAVRTEMAALKLEIPAVLASTAAEGSAGDGGAAAVDASSVAGGSPSGTGTG